MLCDWMTNCIIPSAISIHSPPQHHPLFLESIIWIFWNRICHFAFLFFIHRFLSYLVKALDPSFDGLLVIEDLFQVFPQICTIAGLYERLLSSLFELQKQLPSAYVVYVLSSSNLSEEDRCIMRRTRLPDLLEELHAKYPLNISYPLCNFVCDWQVMKDLDFPCFQAQLSSNVRVTLHSMMNSFILIPLYSLFSFFYWNHAIFSYNHENSAPLSGFIG